MAARNFSNLCRELFASDVFIKGKHVINQNCDILNINTLTVANVCINNNLVVKGISDLGDLIASNVIGNLFGEKAFISTICERHTDNGVNVNGNTFIDNLYLCGKLKTDYINNKTLNEVCISTTTSDKTESITFTNFADTTFNGPTGDGQWQVFEIKNVAQLTKINVDMVRTNGFLNGAIQAKIFKENSTSPQNLLTSIILNSYNGGEINFETLNLFLEPGIYTLQMIYPFSPPVTPINYTWFGHTALPNELPSSIENVVLHLSIYTNVVGGLKVGSLNTCVDNTLKLEFRDTNNCDLKFTGVDISTLPGCMNFDLSMCDNGNILNKKVFFNDPDFGNIIQGVFPNVCSNTLFTDKIAPKSNITHYDFNFDLIVDGDQVTTNIMSSNVTITNCIQPKNGNSLIFGSNIVNFSGNVYKFITDVLITTENDSNLSGNINIVNSNNLNINENIVVVGNSTITNNVCANVLNVTTIKPKNDDANVTICGDLTIHGILHPFCIKNDKVCKLILNRKVETPFSPFKIFQDDFNRVNPNIDGDNWTIGTSPNSIYRTSGTELEITGNVIEGESAQLFAGSPLFSLPSSENFEISFNIRWLSPLQGGGRNGGLLLFYQNPSAPVYELNNDCNGYMIRWADLNNFQIFSCVNGTENLLQGVQPSNDPPAFWRITVIGDQINVYGDGSLELSITDTTYRSGYVGLYVRNALNSVPNQDIRVDNFCISQLGWNQLAWQIPNDIVYDPSGMITNSFNQFEPNITIPKDGVYSIKSLTNWFNVDFIFCNSKHDFQYLFITSIQNLQGNVWIECGRDTKFIRPLTASHNILNSYYNLNHPIADVETPFSRTVAQSLNCECLFDQGDIIRLAYRAEYHIFDIEDYTGSVVIDESFEIGNMVSGDYFQTYIPNGNCLLTEIGCHDNNTNFDYTIRLYDGEPTGQLPGSTGPWTFGTLLNTQTENANAVYDFPFNTFSYNNVPLIGGNVYTVRFDFFGTPSGDFFRGTSATNSSFARGFLSNVPNRTDFFEYSIRFKLLDPTDPPDVYIGDSGAHAESTSMSVRYLHDPPPPAPP